MSKIPKSEYETLLHNLHKDVKVWREEFGADVRWPHLVPSEWRLLQMLLARTGENALTAEIIQGGLEEASKRGKEIEDKVWAGVSEGLPEILMKVYKEGAKQAPRGDGEGV